MTKELNQNQAWFAHPIRVFPHHTDYAGVVWHGSYVNWMEEARVEYLRAAGVNFENLVAAGIDLPVVDLSMRYHLAAKMGMDLVILVRLASSSKPRLTFDYEIRGIAEKFSKNNSENNSLKYSEKYSDKYSDKYSEKYSDKYISAAVSLVPIDTTNRKIIRVLPPLLEAAIGQLLKTTQETAI